MWDLEGQKKSSENNKVSEKTSDFCQTAECIFGVQSSKPKASQPWMADHIAGTTSTDWRSRVRHCSSQSEQIYRLFLPTSLPKGQTGGG